MPLYVVGVMNGASIFQRPSCGGRCEAPSMRRRHASMVLAMRSASLLVPSSLAYTHAIDSRGMMGGWSRLWRDRSWSSDNDGVAACGSLSSTSPTQDTSTSTSSTTTGSKPGSHQGDSVKEKRGKQAVDYTTLAACCRELSAAWVPAKVEQVGCACMRGESALPSCDCVKFHARVFHARVFHACKV